MDPAVRRRALRLLSNGVYVLTSRNDAQFGAATVSWVSQASFKPPLLMAAVRRDSNVFQCMARSRSAALHILSEQQQDVARRFFFPTKAQDGRLNGEPFTDGMTVAPILTGLPAYVECRVEQIVDTAGDHAVVILSVVQAECPEPIRPLTVAQTSWEYGG